MEEALEILWTYARREPLDSNGETVVPTINNSIAAIRIIMRLEGWAIGSEKRKVNSEKRATPDKPARDCWGEWQFAQHNTTNNDNDDEYTEGELLNEGELLTYSALADFAPTPAQHQYPQHNTVYNNYPSEACACLVAPSPSERGLGERISAQIGFGERIRLPYHEVLSRFAKVSYTMSKARKPYHSNLRVQVAGLSIQATCNQQKKQRRNAACKVKESKSISPYEYSCAVSHKHSKAAALMLDKNRIRPPCVALIINGIKSLISDINH